MPELPEVERVFRVLSSKIRGEQIKRVKVYSDWNRIPSVFREELYKQPVQGLARHGKSLFFIFPEKILMVHLGMSGYFRLGQSQEKHRKHEHYAWIFPDFKLFYCDPRRFGRVKFVPYQILSELESETQITLPSLSLGVDALNPLLNPNRASAMDLWNKHVFHRFLPATSIKYCLLKQKGICGIGNIYASEILFASRISPEDSIGDLSAYQKRRLVFKSWEILSAAVKNHGTSTKGANPYRDPFEKKGKFQEFLHVYGRNGKKCKICKDKIRKISIKSRSTFYCPTCQNN